MSGTLDRMGWNRGVGERWMLAVSAVAVMAALLTGCGMIGPVACPAIGWMNTLTVEVEQPADQVAKLHLCAGADCEELDVASGAGGSAPDSLARFDSRVGDRWVFTLDMGAPDEMTVTALDAAGGVLVEQPVTVDWVRVGGSEQCGGPSEGTATVSVPS